MTNRLSIIIVTCAAALSAAAAGARGSASVQELGKQAYDAIWNFRPVDATCNGFHQYDGELGQYTPARFQDFSRKLKAILARVERLDTTPLSLDDRIDRDLLVSNLQMELFSLETLQVWRTNPMQYSDQCINGVYYLLLRNFAPLSVRAGHVAERLAQIPGLIDEARRNVADPPRLYAVAAIDELKTGEEFLNQSTQDLARQFPKLSPALESGAEQAVTAMRAYRKELEQRLPGLKDSFAMGKANFDYMLKAGDLLPFDSDSLLRIGENVMAQSDSEIKALEQQRKDSPQPKPAHEDSVLQPPAGFSKQDIMAYQQDEIDSMRAWVGQAGIATVPDYVGRLQMTETPAFLLGINPGAAMEPPAPFDSVQTSYYYEPPFPEPLDSATRVNWYNTAHYRRWKGGVVHEGYPGHHLQLSIANHNPSFIRKLQGSIPMIEGWALYCEQLAAERGLYGNDIPAPLHWLGGVKFRAARVILDTKLHTGRMSYDDAWEFMVQNFGPDTAFFQSEVRRYCLEPTQPMSYLTGKLQIMALRDDYLRAHSGATLRDFHDHLLAEGSIPVSLIRRKLLPQ
jgi:uncharacterized protein (DUF885 family)